jgi:penicillin-binding protein 2
VGIVPDDLPYDDLTTPDIDEEAQEIARVLQVLGAHEDTDVALRIAEVMFRRLGRLEYAETVTNVGVELNYVLAPGPTEVVFPEDGGPPAEVSTPILVPDISQPLPLEALVALIKRLITYQRQGSASTPVTILDLVPPERAFEITEESYRLPSVRVHEVPVRHYEEGALLSHILGFMGPIPAAVAEEYRERGYRNPNERVGLNGLEYSYQRELRGIPGYKNVEVDILGREMRTVGQVAEPVPGLNLVLSIDTRLQQVMQEALQDGMDTKEAQWGVAIAMNPMDGSVLGMVSLPTYDNNVFAERINEDYLALERDQRRPLINYAIGGLYAPGSIFKLVTAAAALSEGAINANTVIVDTGPIYLPNRFVPNDPSMAQRFVSWNHRYGFVHGSMTVVEALAYSNNIFFYIIAGGYPPTQFVGAGQRKMAEWTQLMGYGPPTGIDLPGEVGAVVPTDRWKRQVFAESWTTGDTYNMAIGHGYILSTPLQVLVSAAAVANGGTILEPRIVRQMLDSAGGLQYDYTPSVVRELPISDADLRLIQEGMYSAVNRPRGTSFAARVEGVTVAGKTGTAEFCEYIAEIEDCRRTVDDNLPIHAWFVAYAPYEEPEIAVLVFVYEGGEGSETAAPVTQRILEAYFHEIKPR